jgi:sugar phosphate isomerase/epimerase
MSPDALITVAMDASPDARDDTLSRRDLLSRAGTLLAAAPLLTPLERAQALTLPGQPRAKLLPIGIEMFAVRREQQKDLPNTLRTLKGMGYEAVEFFAPYLSWSFPAAKDVRLLLDDLGLRCHSTHNGFASFTPGDTMTKAIEINQILGARHLVLASPPFRAGSAEEWKRLCAQMTAAADTLRPHGLLAGWHNHDAEWVTLPEGGRVMDLIAANTPQDFVLQLDVGTCVKAGADPVAWVRANPGRIRSCHLKDWAPGEESAEKSYRVLFGEGVSPWRPLMAALEAVGGLEFYLMEQEGSRYSEFDSARRCLEAFKAMRRS